MDQFSSPGSPPASRPWANLLLVCPLLLALAAAAAEAQDHQHHDHQGHDHHASPAMQPTGGQDAVVEPLDLPVVDQHGTPMRFATDVLGDHLVVATFVYTSCTTVCPVSSGIFAGLQDMLGDRLGTDVRLVSLSVDAVNDTPARLAEAAGRYGSRPGWIWLTGDQQEMDRLLDGLGAYTPDFRNHPVMTLIGDPANGRWTRLYGFVAPERLLEEIDRMAALRAGGKG